MLTKYSVKIGEFRVVNKPTILESLGIGSCIAICLFDPVFRIAGLAHILLGKSPKIVTVNPFRFADRAIDVMLREIERMGSKRENIQAKIIGGASMFNYEGSPFDAGKKNIIAVKEKLKKEKIKIVAEDLGGKEGKSIWMDTSDGKVVVSKIFGPTREI